MASKNGSVANALRDKAGTKSWERGGIRFCFSRRCSSAVVVIAAAVPLGVGDGANFPIARFAVLIFIIMNFGAVSTTAVQLPHWLTFGNRHNTLQLSAGWRSSLLSLLNNQQELLACLLATHRDDRTGYSLITWFRFIQNFIEASQKRTLHQCYRLKLENSCYLHVQG